MADLLPPLNYAGQIAQAAGQYANMGPESALTSSQAGLTQQQAQSAAIQNYIARIKIPLQQQLVNQTQGMLSGYGQPQQQPGVGGGQQTPGNISPLLSGFQGNPTANQQTSPTFGQNGEQPNPQPTSTEDAPEETGEQAQQVPTGAQLSQLTDAFASNYQPGPVDMNADQAKNYFGLKLAESQGVASPGAAEGYKDSIEAQNKNTNQQKEVVANKIYSIAQAVSRTADQTDDVDKTRAVLRTLAPGEDQALPQDATLAQVKEFADSTGNSIFRYTGRPLEVGKDGYYYTQGQRILGDNTKVGISPEAAAQIANDLQTPTTIIGPGGAQRTGERWELTPGFKSYNDALTKTIAAQGQGTPPATPSQGAAVPVPGAPTSAPQGPSTAPPATNTRGIVSQIGASAGGTPIKSSNSPNGVLDLSDAPPAPTTSWSGARGATPQEQEDINTYTPDVRTANKEASELVNAAQTNITRDQQLLQLVPSAGFGPGSELVSKVQTLAQELSKNQQQDADNGKGFLSFLGDPSNTQVLNKSLGVGGITEVSQAIHDAGAGSARFSALLGGMITGKLAANPTLTKKAVQLMLRWDVANQKYTQQMYGPDYQAATSGPTPVDVDKYPDWYESKYPRETAFPNYLSHIDSLGRTTDSQGFVPGAQYTDKNGNRKTYGGSGKWQDY